MTTNNLQGLGNDIVEISRIRQSIERHGMHFLNRLFSQREQDYCYKFQDPVPHFAGRFAAKEAIFKAMGMADLSWHDVTILNDANGKPFCQDNNKKFKHRLLISISHCKNYAVASAIVEA